MTIKAVLFDCDGVLADSGPPTFQMLAEDFTRFDLTVTAAAVAESFTGCTIHDVAARAQGMGADLPDGWTADFHERLFVRLGRSEPVKLQRG